MGYTHYWDYQPEKINDTEELRKRFGKAISLIKKLQKEVKLNPFIHRGNAGAFYDDKPCVIKGGHGVGRPIINESEVWLNGDQAQGLDHETFSIYWSQTNGHNFCKTARKPYDLFVGVCLLAFQDALGPKVFSFSSDGSEQDWAQIHEVYHSLKNPTQKGIKVVEG